MLKSWLVTAEQHAATLQHKQVPPMYMPYDKVASVSAIDQFHEEIGLVIVIIIIIIII